jgi:hypothetical protein
MAMKLAVGLLPAILAVVAAFGLSVSFMQALYALKSKREAFWFLVHCLIGQASFKPWLMLEQGKINTTLSDPDSLIARHGGPGNLVIRKDTAAVLEQAGRLTRVEGPGLPKLQRFEHLYDTIDLRPIRRQVSVTGLSKEGIPVTCSADIQFQIQQGPEQSSADNPYPMDPDAVFQASMSKWIREADRPKNEQALDWRGFIVDLTAEMTLRAILARYPVDRLIAAEDSTASHPRVAIRRELRQSLHMAASDVGARILKVELGQMTVDDEVTQQWIERWQTDWGRWEAEYLASADAARIKEVGEVRSEAIASKIRNTANVLYELANLNHQAFVSGAMMQLHLALRNVGTDSLALTYMPAEATKLLEQTAHLTPPGGGAPGGGL